MDSSKLISELIIDEGLRLKIYFDSKGVPTIGVGHNLRDKPISEAAAFFIVGDDVHDVEVDLDKHLQWWRKLDETRQRVLANMCFNMGVARLLGFHKFLGFAEAGDYAGAASEMLDSKWAREDVQPTRSQRLSAMMRDGDAHVAVVA